jgi:hypothetical protein
MTYLGCGTSRRLPNSLYLLARAQVMSRCVTRTAHVNRFSWINIQHAILDLSDGTRPCTQIVSQLNREFDSSDASDHLAWVENLLTTGLIEMRDSRLAASNRSQT